MGNYYISNQNDSDYLKHFGIQGMKWGQRRYQYEDGSLTPEGKAHYGIGERTARTISDLRTAYTAKRKQKQRNKKQKAFFLVKSNLVVASMTLSRLMLT